MRYRSLDAWRGIAALSVVVCHATGAFGANAQLSDFNPVFGAFWWVGRYGYLGVHIFFVISGYCIAANLASSLDRKETAIGFLRDRALRIYPVYWAAFAFFIVLGAGTAPLIGRSPFSVLPQSLDSLLLNTTLLQPLFVSGYLLGVTWTLAYEVAFYFISAIGIVLTAIHLGPSWAVVGGTVLAFAGLLLHDAFFPLDLWPEFFSGMLVFCALYSTERNKRVQACICGALLLILVAVGVAVVPSAKWLWFVVASSTSLLLLLLFPFDVRFSALRWVKPLASVGVFSYTLYLVHFSIVNKIMNVSKRFVATDSAWLVPILFLAVAIAIAFAYVFYRIIEVPCEIFRKNIRKKFRLAASH
jgi:peptidoglycan/LPS O-acetylase OafA/YrhL